MYFLGKISAYNIASGSQLVGFRTSSGQSGWNNTMYSFNIITINWIDPTASKCIDMTKTEYRNCQFCQLINVNKYKCQ